MTESQKVQSVLGKVRKRELSQIPQCLIDYASNSNTKEILSMNLENEGFLLDEYKKLQGQVKITIMQEIRAQAKKRQINVFNTMTVQQNKINQTYLEGFQKSNKNSLTIEFLNQKIVSRENKILGQILQGKIEIINVLCEKNSCESDILKSRISQDNNRYYSQVSLCPASQPRSLKTKQLHNIFSLRSTKTQLISKYIRSKRVQQMQIKQRSLKLQQMKQRSLQKQRKQQEQKYKQQQQIKRNSLLKLIKQRMVKRQNDKKKQTEIIKQSSQFLKRKQKPLFQRLKDKQLVQLKSEQQKLNSKLAALRKCMKALDASEMNSFQQSYLENKQQRNKIRDQKIQRIKTEQEANTKKYYKSRFHHQYVQKPEQELTGDKKSKKQRINQYSQQVQDKIKIVSDERLKQQLKMLMMKQQSKYKRPKKRHRKNKTEQNIEQSDILLEEQQPNGKQDGLKFLKFAKSKRNKTMQVKKSVLVSQQLKLNDNQSNNSDIKKVHLNDHQLLKKFIHNIKSGQYSDTLKKQLFHTKIHQLDTKAHRSQQLLRIQSQKQKYYESCQGPQQYYIDSIKTKLELLKL